MTRSRTVVLTFERDRWHAHGEGVYFVHRELRGLEALIVERIAGETPVDVELAFDMAALPRWLHQYHGHYCNYTLHVPRRGAIA